MLCFLLPVMPALPPRPEKPRPSRCSPRVASVLCAAAAGLALLTPVGWVHSMPMYALRAGITSHLGPRPEEKKIAERFQPQGKLCTRIRFFARDDKLDSLPPGLSVDAATGAIVGVPLLPGTYTLTVGAADGSSEPVFGPPFKVKVLPAL